MVRLVIDNINIEAAAGMTILEAAKQADIYIPTLCYLKDINEIGACRICMVEVEGEDRLVASCNTQVREGMVVRTNTPKVRGARRLNLELILSQHDARCTTCVRSGNCQLQKLANDYNLCEERFDSERQYERDYIYSPITRKDNRCIKCMRCIQVCDKIQGMSVYDLIGTGARADVGTRKPGSFASNGCTFCGQCVTHCPVGALVERDETRLVLDALADPTKTTVVQIAPAVRTAWAAHYGIPAEVATAEKLVTCFKKMGFDYVFDTNFTADLTIMEEGSEFLERFTHRDEYSWPMFTSCCPGWVRFVKGEFPGYTENLSTAKSPQAMFGAVAKSYFAEKIGVDPKDMVVVSIMPCTAKKAEANIPNLNDACGDPDVDIVLTTREAVRMFRGENFNPATLPETPFDSPLGSGTGAAVIFGATGGVMDAALRSAYYLVTGGNPDADAFKAVRGMDGWKEAEFEIPGAGTVRAAVVSGLANTRALMEAIDAGKVSYDFVEVMACPGGCAGGGGQPISEGEELAEERGRVLWNLDASAEIRFSHENPEVLALYDEYLGKPLGEKSHHLLHTELKSWNIEEVM